LRSFRTCNLILGYNQNDEIKDDEMTRACSMNGTKKIAYRILVGNQEGKRPIGRPRRTYVDNIKMELREMECTELIWLRIGTTGGLL
jgi:hypothetical protein